MSYRAYSGRPALVARYHRRSAPASVHLVALLQYLSALLVLAAAGLVVMIARGVTRNLALDRIPDSVRSGLDGGSLVIAVTLAVLGLLWLVIARKLQRGRQWARITVVMLSLLSIAGAAYDTWHSGNPRLLVGLALPLVYLTLLNTRAARSWFRHGTW